MSRCSPGSRRRVVAPHRPVMLGEHHVGVGPQTVDGLVEVSDQACGSRTSAPRREQVVQVVGGILGHVERAEARDRTCASRRAPRSRRHLEDSISTPSIVCVSTGRANDRASARSARRAPGEVSLAEPGIDLARGPVRQQAAELELRAPMPSRAGQHVLLDRSPP